MNEDIRNMLDMMASDNTAEATAIFNNIVADKVGAAMENMRVDVANEHFNGMESVDSVAGALSRKAKNDAEESGETSKLNRAPSDKPGFRKVQNPQTGEWMYVKLRESESKYKIKEEVEQIEEISAGVLARAANYASDPDSDGKHDPDKFAAHAAKHHGAKIGKQIGDAYKGHWPKEYGKEGKTVSSGYDKLAFRQNRSTSSTHVTKDGKLTKNSQKGLKSALKD